MNTTRLELLPSSVILGLTKQPGLGLPVLGARLRASLWLASAPPAPRLRRNQRTEGGQSEHLATLGR